MVKDPVCLMEINPRQATAMSTYEGRSYYFCSESCRQKFEAQPELFLNKAPGMRLIVGVMGSASRTDSTQFSEKAYALGQAIAKQGFNLITGACSGLPYECARGMQEGGGLSIGISPGLSLDEHIHKYLSPSDAYDILIYTGSGLMGREVTNIRSSDMVIILGGRSGTLGEFAIAYDEGKLIGVLEGTGGITEHLPEIVTSFGQKDTGARVIYNTDPEELVRHMADTYTTVHYKHPSCFCAETSPAADK